MVPSLSPHPNCRTLQNENKGAICQAIGMPTIGTPKNQRVTQAKCAASSVPSHKGMERNAKAKWSFLPMGRKYRANIAEKGENHATIHARHTTTSKSTNTQHDPCQQNKGE
jgi:hypothetical protein